MVVQSFWSALFCHVYKMRFEMHWKYFSKSLQYSMVMQSRLRQNCSGPTLRMHILISVYWKMEEELGECLTWDPFVQKIIVWCMLCFGLRSAPLIWSRFAAALARLLTAMLRPSEGRMQLYLDDPFWVLFGFKAHRAFLISMHLSTIAALGVRVA